MVIETLHGGSFHLVLQFCTNFGDMTQGHRDFRKVQLQMYDLCIHFFYPIFKFKLVWWLHMLTGSCSEAVHNLCLYLTNFKGDNCHYFWPQRNV